MAFVKLNIGMGFFAMVDLSDLEKLAAYRWVHFKSGKTRYVVANHVVDGKRVLLSMHRLLMSNEITKSRPFVDHINGNGLDNRRVNLRAVSHQENSFNYKSSRLYKGVVLLKSGRYNARIKHNRKQRSLGCYSTPEEAAKRYDEEAKKLFGEFAKLNFTVESEGIIND